jgi:hypothetical protein
LTWNLWAHLGLVVVLAFLVHDGMMVAPSPVAAAESPLTLTRDSDEARAAPSHPHDCDVGRRAVLEASESSRNSSTAVVVGHLVPFRKVAPASHAADTRPRSPAARRAVLQIFRL